MREGDETAARAIYKYIEPTVSQSLFRVDPADRDDVIQEIFQRIFENLHRFEGRSPLLHWCARIARNTSFSHVKGYVRERSFFDRLASVFGKPPRGAAEEDIFDQANEPPPDASDWIFGGGSGSDEMDDRTLHCLNESLAALDETDRSIVQHIIYGGCTFKKIGLMLGLPLNTAYSKYRKAIETIKRQFTKCMKGGM